MVLNENLADLIGVLEYKIGSQTYNPNSYNGWTREVGRGFKYPVSYCRNKADWESHVLTKTKSCIEHLDPDCVGTMKYTFGSNHLYIGEGLVEVLEYLEKIYNIDFNKLEGKRIEKKKKELVKSEELLNSGKAIKVDSGTKKVEMDIPVGKYTMMRREDSYSNYLSAEIYDDNNNLVRDIFTGDDEEVLLKKGYYVHSSNGYYLKKGK